MKSRILKRKGAWIYLVVPKKLFRTNCCHFNTIMPSYKDDSYGLFYVKSVTRHAIRKPEDQAIGSVLHQLHCRLILLFLFLFYIFPHLYVDLSKNNKIMIPMHVQ